MSKSNPKQSTKSVSDMGMFYAVNDQAVADMASFPWNQTLGEQIKFTTNDPSSTSSGGSTVIPGGIQILFNPALGYNDSGSRVTRAADALYQNVTQVYTGGVEYEAPDFMMLLIAAENLYSLLCVGKRGYAATKYYLQQNSYFAQNLVQSLGFNYSDLVANLADFRAEFNTRVEEINKIIAVPADFMLGNRWEMLCSCLFVDDMETDHFQFISFLPKHYWKYDATSLTTGTCLLSVPTNFETGLTFEQYFSLLDTVINSLKGDDQRSMFSLIRRAYSSTLKTVTGILEDDDLRIVYDDSILAMVHNANWIGSAVKYYHPATMNAADAAPPFPVAMYQSSTGKIVSQPYCGGSANGSLPVNVYMWKEHIFTLFKHLRTPKNVLDISSLMLAFRFDEATSVIAKENVVGIYGRTEIIEDVKLILRTDVGASNYLTIYNAPAGPITLSSYGALTSLNYAPIIYEKTGVTISGMLGEIDEYTIISNDDIISLNDRTYYKLLAVPVNSESITR